MSAVGPTDLRSPAGLAQPVSLRSVALPTEHGGWSLTAEPAVLGLLVAWSWPGLALAVAAMLAFVARTPLKLVLVDRWRGRWLARSRLGAKVAAVELAILAVLVTYAAMAADAGFWLPLALAAPMVAVELWFDMRSRSRRLIPELAGSIGIGSIATAVALAGGAPNKVAWGLWVVIAARSIAAIPYVRTQILRGKSRPPELWHSDVAQVLAVAAAGVGWLIDVVPAPAALVIGAVAAMNIVAVRTKPPRVVVIGVQQMVVGVLVVAVTAIAILTA
ncbi:MAG: YwiC-like family protein [Acidimicrobiales bacterium]